MEYHQGFKHCSFSKIRKSRGFAKSSRLRMTSWLPSQKLTHLKMDGWNISFLLGWLIFKGQAVSFREPIKFWKVHPQKNQHFEPKNWWFGSMFLLFRSVGISRFKELDFRGCKFQKKLVEQFGLKLWDHFMSFWGNGAFSHDGSMGEWYIYLHGWWIFCGKCRWISHTLILWVMVRNQLPSTFSPFSTKRLQRFDHTRIGILTYPQA